MIVNVFGDVPIVEKHNSKTDRINGAMEIIVNNKALSQHEHQSTIIIIASPHAL